MKSKEAENPQKPNRSPNVVHSAFGDDAVVFHQVSKQYFVLNTTARRIWDLSDGKRSVAAIAERIRREFGGVPERVEADVSQTVQGLVELGLLET